MKTISKTAFLMISILLCNSIFSAKFSTIPLFPIHVVFSAKSYWDGETKSCIPREKGGCCHIWLEGMVPGPGEISGEMVLVRGKVIQLTVSRIKGMNKETHMRFFSEGFFTLDGPITFDPDILFKLGLRDSYVVPAGKYPYSMNGDVITITFK